MTARDMHYDFKQKLNRLDSQKYRDLLIPAIDWKLNEACEIFVKMIAQPRLKTQLGFEINQRTIDDIRTIVVDQKPSEYTTPVVYDENSFVSPLPPDYWFLVNINILASKGECKNVLLYDSQPVQHDDNSESSSYSKSSFEWRASNYRFNREGIRIFTDSSYIIDKVGLEYLKRPKPIYNATDWKGGSYIGLDGITYTGMQDCELPPGTHREIVDIAVMITAGDLNLPTTQKMNKIKINN